MVTVIVPVCPGCSTSGANGPAVAWLAANQRSPVDEVAAGSNALVVAIADSVAVPLTGPLVGPIGVGAADHRPCVTRSAEIEALAVRPCDMPYSSGTPLMSNEASKSAGIVEDCSMAKVLLSVGTNQTGPTAVDGNGRAIVESLPGCTSSGKSTDRFSRGSAKYAAGAAPLLCTFRVTVIGAPAFTLPLGTPAARTSTELYRRCPVKVWLTTVPLIGLLTLMNSVHRPAAGART